MKIRNRNGQVITVPAELGTAFCMYVAARELEGELSAEDYDQAIKASRVHSMTSQAMTADVRFHFFEARQWAEVYFDVRRDCHAVEVDNVF